MADNQTTEHCGICNRPLDQPDDPSSRNCGGDCLRCMAECGDPDCMASMDRLGLPYRKLEELGYHWENGVKVYHSWEAYYDI